MGVPGLWDLLRPAATRTSLSTLAREAFYQNKNGRRALTIGIDASIWIFHAQIPQYGENPFMRTIFFKITSLLQHPVLPVFVFDGPNKPSRKRGERVAGQFGTSDYRSRQFKELLDACGLEWWNAPGEAEAELAVMSRQGKIDAVLSDDVDALLFGATCLLRNNSPTLSGAQASSTQGNSSKSELRHYEMYRSSAIVKQWTEREGTALKTEEDCRMAMVWIALLGGGDYAPEGLAGFGPTITYALANAGISDFLRRYRAGRPVDEIDVSRAHASMIDELRTNASGHLGRRYPARASELQVKDPKTLFPAFALDAYLRPSTSDLDDSSRGWPGFGSGEAVFQKRGKARNEGRGDLEGFAIACERFFEWGTKDIVAKKFASENVGLFGSELVTCARERVRLRDPKPAQSKAKDVEGEATAATGSRITSFFQSTSAPSRSNATKPRKSFTDMPSHVIKIHSSRLDPTNPDLKEYRVAFTPTAYIERCHAVMDGHRVDPKELDAAERATLGLVDKDEPALAAPAKAEVRLWLAEYLISEAWPELLQAYEEELAAKVKPKSKSKSTAKKAVKKGGEEVGANKEVFKSFFTQPSRPVQTQRAVSPEEEEETIEYRPPSSRSSTLTPPPPSSPLPSLERIRKNVRRTPPSSNSASTTSSRHPIAATTETSPASKSPSPRRAPRRTARSAKAAKASKEVIDLCSTDDETPLPLNVIPRRALATTSRTNSTPAITTKKITKSKSPEKFGSSSQTPKSKSPEKINPSSQTQSLLSLPVVRPMTKHAGVNSTGKGDDDVVKQSKTKKKGKEKTPLFLVTYEDDEVVEIDVRGRWARGESVGIWEDVV